MNNFKLAKMRCNVFSYSSLADLILRIQPNGAAERIKNGGRKKIKQRQEACIHTSLTNFTGPY